MARQRPEQEVLSSLRVQPSRPTSRPTITHLSIVDSTVATIGDASAIWVFRPDNTSERGHSEAQLLDSLAATLSSYPHFAGQLGLMPWPQGKTDAVPHTHRFRRVFVSHGSVDDPGIGLEFAKLDMDAASIFPDRKNLKTAHNIWDMTGVNLMDMFGPSEDTPIRQLAMKPDRPSVWIRATFLACQSLVIVPKIAHPLADAETMIAFMRAWGQVYRAMKHHRSIPHIQPLFKPGLLDEMARGDIDAPTEDLELIDESLRLPLPRYDWWERRPGHPTGLDDSPQAKLPLEIPSNVLDSRRRGTAIPWDEWDLKAPVRHTLFRLSGSEIETLHHLVSSKTSDTSIKVSHHDVILAFIWQLTTVSRPSVRDTTSRTSSATELVSLDTTIGLRTRLGLPKSFVGSPVLLAGLTASRSRISGICSGLSDSDIGDLATMPVMFPDIEALATAAEMIRRHISRFDRSSLGAWLHEQAFEISPQRWWNGFLGSKHTLATSWVRAGLWDVAFGESESPLDSVEHVSERPELVQPALEAGPLWAGVIGANLDGLVTIFEAEAGHRRDWWLTGLDIDVKLESNAMARAISLVTMWRGRSCTLPSS